MKLRKTNRKSHKKIIIISIILVLIVMAGGTVFAIYKHSNDTQSTAEKAKQQKAEQDASNQGKKDFIENTTPDGSTSNTVTTTPPASSINVSAQKESSGSVTVFTKLVSISDGSCTLKIINGSKSLTKSANVLYQADYSTCAGFTISSVEAAQLGTGNWNINLSVASNSTSYTGSVVFVYGAN